MQMLGGRASGGGEEGSFGGGGGGYSREAQGGAGGGAGGGGYGSAARAQGGAQGGGTRAAHKAAVSAARKARRTGLKIWMTIFRSDPLSAVLAKEKPRAMRGFMEASLGWVSCSVVDALHTFAVNAEKASPHLRCAPHRFVPITIQFERGSQ